MNSHIRALRQHNDRILDNAPVSAALRWGLKSNPQIFYLKVDTLVKTGVQSFVDF
jgi:hypothetical protein